MKFASREMARGPGEVAHDFVLWVGVRSNLPPLVDWINRHRLELPLVVLTNLEQEAEGVGDGTDGRRDDRKITDRKMGRERSSELAAAFGFMKGREVWVEDWSAQRQRELTAIAAGAIDIKGDDFRQRHKPPAKAIDFIASGLPLAMNESSSTEQLARLGFEIASPLDAGRWFSGQYREDTAAFGRELRERLSLRRVGMAWSTLVEEVLEERMKEEGLRMNLEDPPEVGRKSGCGRSSTDFADSRRLRF